MATDHMHGMSAENLLSWILGDLENGSALGIVRELFFTPRAEDPFRLARYGTELESPLGVAAGPHTQMAQNIVAAWLTGARYIELKTVQVLDTISVTKPCIDMADEGYNCEWSQELTLDQSYDEYLKAWVLVHALHDRLGGKGRPGVIFNMSAGYSLEGILSPTVQRFLDRMGDAGADVKALQKRLAPIYPRIMKLDIPGRISDNLTISCMHGCPPEEVEKIALYFIEQRGYHTTLKMNPTLLGPNCTRGILNKTLGYETEIPDLAFEHDLPYGEALKIIGNCLEAAQKKDVSFSIKLTNTLESVNGKQNLPDSEKMIYMSGRALHPLAVSLAARLQRSFGGGLDISFCAGLDALNVADSLACGLAPLTVCSDLLKPGGYGRLAQYIDELRGAMAGFGGIDEFILARAGLSDRKEAIVKNLEAYAERVTAPDSRYAKKAAGNPDVKTSRPLPALDCAAAPCMSSCPAGQDIPAYLERAAAGDLDGSLAVILSTNPMPSVLGKMCNQACRSKCMRKHYEGALRIRDVKGCVAGADTACGDMPEARKPNGRKAAVIGADPAGLSCAFFLALAGCSVQVYDSAEKPGGPMLSRLGKEAGRVAEDVRRIEAAGVDLRLGHALDGRVFEEICVNNDAVYVSAGDFAGSGRNNVFEGPGASMALVESVGEGRRAAEAALRFLQLMPPEKPCRSGRLDIQNLRKKQAWREDYSKQPVTAESVAREAARCLQCDRYCGICVSVCPNRANILIQGEARSWPVQEVRRGGNGTRIVTLAQKSLRQTWQVLNLGDFCNECGNCAAFCPSSGAPYRDKIRMHLSERSFNADDNGFFRRGPDLVEGKSGGTAWTLREHETVYVYEDSNLRATLDKNSLEALEAELLNGASSASLAGAVEAAIVSSYAAGNPALRSVAE